MKIPLALALLTLEAVPSLRALAPGVEYGALPLPRKAEVGPSVLHVVRLDPDVVHLEVRAASITGGGNRTAGRWCEDSGAVVAVNAGMYADDHRTHTGYLRVGRHTNSESWAKDYQSVLLLDPKLGAKIVDREDDALERLLPRYHTAAQNLRLLKHEKENVWQPTKRRWSEAAIAQDGKGRLLFVFSRSPYSMHRFNEMLARLPLGIVAAQHAEGGPEASLSIRTPGLSLDLSGSYETGFNEDDENRAQWRIPNVVIALAPPFEE